MHEEKIMLCAKNIEDKLIKIRRDLHAHPELGLEEYRTSGIIAAYLEELGLEVKRGVGKTGVVALLRGSMEGKTILLRADMDCLKLDEKNEIDYKSVNKGYMHACGHDAHITWLLGAAMILCDFKEQIKGNVKFVFQPAEEFSAGAELMIAEGVLENPKVDAAIGAHIWPYVEAGKIAVKSGAIMASTDMFKIEVHGEGGHGAHPHKCIDPLVAATEIFMALQTIVSRRIDPLEPAVVTVGKFNAGTAYNIISDKALMEGTIRTINNETREKIPKIMEEIINGITEANGASYKFQYQQFHPPVMNDKNMTELIKKSTEKLLGKDALLNIEKPAMTGEDFSFFQQKIPGVFFWVGNGDEEKCTNVALHSPNFKVEESNLVRAAALFAECALEFLL